MGGNHGPVYPHLPYFSVCMDCGLCHTETALSKLPKIEEMRITSSRNLSAMEYSTIALYACQGKRAVASFSEFTQILLLRV